MTNRARLFLGVDLHLSVSEKLVLVQEDLQPIIEQRGAAVRWTRPENLHVTLKYLGDVERSLTRRIVDVITPVIKRREPFLFLNQGVSAFPGPTTPRILLGSVTRGRETLESLSRDIDEATATLGIPRVEHEPRPWAMLGRIKTPEERIDLSDVFEALREVKLGATEVRDVVLYESLLTPKGAHFKVLTRVHVSGIDQELKKLRTL